jgi:uncharacterized protein (TIGR02145 family)
MAKKTIIAGNTFLFTGKLTEFTREEAEAHVEAEGGKVLSGVSAKLNYLVVGEDAGSKLAKAESLGTVTILHEKEFLKMMKKKTSVKSSSKTTTATKKTVTKKAEKKVVAKTATKANTVNKETTSIEEVTIGKQVWMTRNLDVLKFKNGDSIKLAKSASEWEKLNEKGTPACCYYEGTDINKENKILLYNWFAVNDKRGLAPEGWIVPSLDDWNQLVSFVGGNKKAVRKLKSKEIWDGSDYLINDSFGNNETGFNLLPTGERSLSSSIFQSAKLSALLWTSNPSQTKSAFYVKFDCENKYTTSWTYRKLGFAVRCIKK